MSEILKYILFRTVLVIITLHAVVSHRHLEEFTEEKHFQLHKEVNSLFGIIRLVFHESNDESLDNLIFAQYEDVKKIDTKHKYPNVFTFKNTTSIVGKITTKKKTEWNTNSFDKLLFIKLNRLRGPPIINLINLKYKI